MATQRRIIRRSKQAPNTAAMASSGDDFVAAIGGKPISKAKRKVVEDLTARLKDARENPVVIEAREDKHGQELIGYRLRILQKRELPLSEFFTFIPLRCSWCKIERNPDELRVISDLMVQCINSARCNRERKRALKERAEPAVAAPLKRKIVRRKGVPPSAAGEQSPKRRIVRKRQ